MQKKTGRRVAALIVGLGLVAASCGGDDSSTDTTAASDTTAAASTSNGELEGMKGTTPLVELSQSGNGAHVWILFRYAIDAWIPREFLKRTVENHHLGPQR